jgi:glycosyltransferase involved in cell wall biosynthesis
MVQMRLGSQHDLCAGRKMIIALAGRDIRPTMGFHRVIELLPLLWEKGLKPEIVIPGFIRKARWPIFKHDFLALVKGSPVRNHIRFSKRAPSLVKYCSDLRAADLIILPYEAGNSGVVYSDALYLGKPVVTSDLEGFRRAIKKTGAGLFAADSDELQDAILSFFKNAALRKRLELRALACRGNLISNK